MRLDQRQQLLALATIHGKHPHQTVSLVDAKHDHLAHCAPAMLARTITAKHRLIALHAAFKGFGALFLQRHHPAAQPKERLNPKSGSTQRAAQPKETLGGWQRSRAAKAQPIRRHAKHKAFQQLAFGRFAQTATVLHAGKALTHSARPPIEPTIAQMPKPVMTTTSAQLSHCLASPEFSPL
jgi:hypothetical protein